MTEQSGRREPGHEGEGEEPRLRLRLQDGDLEVEVEAPGGVVGRHTEADLRLPVSDVSRRHCRLLCRGGRWLVLDLNSLNGTFVNEERVEQAELATGDVLRVGAFRFLVEIADETPTLAARIFRMPRPGCGSQPRRAA